MSDHGSSPATATDLTANTGWFSVGGVLTDVNDFDYFKITVTDATNQLIIYSFPFMRFELSVWNPSAVYDSIRTNLVDATDTIVGGGTTFNWVIGAYLQYGYIYTDLPVGDYYVRVNGTYTGMPPNRYTTFIELWDGATAKNNPIKATPVTVDSINIVNVNSNDNPAYMATYPYSPVSVVFNLTYDFIPLSLEVDISHTSLTYPRPRYLRNLHNRDSKFPLRANRLFNTISEQPVGEIPLSSVTKDSNPAVGKLIRLYDRATGEQISYTYTDANGEYSFPNIMFTDEKYFIVAFDDVTAPALEAKIHDFLTPQVITQSI